ncbi:hypothetical protein [Staphylococcus massiliensis]|uniref:Putative phage membrane protein n=2 Tax=Staphylococcus massiliensis TaxID=555791 RepID=K9AZM6_9STAP|nr:hypothetical protein [Staphylococcus massiliensis]EKU48002.1 putative phage membrane protein [Staphylococcus massiliensis S46]MCG3400058.1 hypothetical protein [Staphylococcus massiliensis]MCG3412221.1 hypothetical protein [Staphylococcus massiliensis]PNZ97774.1 hypothetical protein CD133_10125 [Staphylococcus massiliensis CCUG 55927]
MGEVLAKIANIWSQITGKIGQFMGRIVQRIQNGWNRAKSAVANALTHILGKVANIWSQITGKIGEFMGRIVQRIQNGWNRARSAIASAMGRILSVVTNKMNSVVESVKGGVNRAVSAARGFIGDFMSAGQDLINGLIDGIKQMAGDAVAAAKGVVGDAVAGAKSLLGIHSPSKVFKQIGVYTMQGMQIGLNKRGRKVVKDTTRIANAMTGAFKPNLNTATNFSGMTNEMKRLSSKGSINNNHNYTLRTEPNKTHLTVSLDFDDEAITAKVNGINARDEAVFTF